MKKLLMAGLFLFLGVFVLTAQNLPSIRIVNNTGYTVDEVCVSPSDSDIWGENILEDEILENGQTFTYQLRYPLSRVSVYDIGMEDENGNIYVKWEVTITNNVQLVFTIDDLEEEDYYYYYD